MTVPRLLLLAALAGPAALAQAPVDSARTLGRVVVTATRTVEALEDVAVPTTVVDARDAEADGRLRLTDLLADVPGLTITSDFGAGVQVQGLDPAYTLVLIDGEPVIGRDAGVLDLKRLTVSGLDRVEIVRGPSSSLYGSDALAGVINLVTRPPTGNSARLRARAGTFGTTAFTAEGETAGTWRGGPLGVRLMLDRYATTGYDLDPALFGPTTPAVGEATADLRATASLGERTTLDLGARATRGDVDTNYGVAGDSVAGGGGAVAAFDQTERRADWSVHPELRHRFGRVLGATLAGRVSLYGAGYRIDTDIVERADGSPLYTDSFDQQLAKAETTLDALWSVRHRTVVGAGGQRSRLVGAQRYGDIRPEERTVYGFVQHEWEPSRLVALNASARVDAHSAAGSRLTPRVAVLLRPSERLRLRASVGSGFKSPDQRQLYLSFTNPAVGYVVYGTERLAEGLARLEAEGRLVQTTVDVSALGAIMPESSVAVNAEVEAEPLRGLRLTLGGFRNAVTDLIDVQPVAQTTSGLVYSYVNLNRVRTEGVTFDLSAAPLSGLSVGAGFQLLRTRDLDKVDEIRAGTVFSRDEAGREALVTVADYTNLVGRARATGTLRTAYAARGWTASLRGRLRSRTALRDLDGNGVATRADEFVPATAIWDATVSRDVRLGRFARTARLQLGVDNAFDSTQPDLQPTLAGRRVYAALDLSF